MKQLDQHDKERYEFYAANRQPHPNGIACPYCKQELWDSSPMNVLMSSPPKKEINCPACGYRGYRLA